MSDTKVFHHPLGETETAERLKYCELMAQMGYDRFVVAAQGAKFLAGTTDLIDRSIAHFGMWEGSQLDSLAEICALRPVDLFLDVGANSGFYSVMLLTKGLVQEGIAFEPDPGNHAHLLANLFLNDLMSRVKVHPVAVGDKAGEVTLSEAGEWNRGESWVIHADKPPEEATTVATHTVRQIKFDDEFAIAGKTIVMKMDVEGSEFHALDGMRRTLAENQVYAQVELYSDRLDELKSLFSSLGYRYLRTDYIDHFFTNRPDIG
jgi:FkbM family methyltransferase